MRNNMATDRKALHGIASFEAFKGIAVLAGSVGLLSLVHHDVRHVVHEVVVHLGMNPNGRYPAVLLHYADLLQSTNLRFLIILALAYATLRFIEAYGLWNDMAWGKWIGALSGGIYIPFEIQHIIHKPSAIGGVVMLVNACIVGYLAVQLYRRRHSVPQSPP